MTDELKTDKKSVKLKNSFAVLAMILAIFPILLTPPLMDVRYWFINSVSNMDYSASNIFEGQHFLRPGRFVPISQFYVLVYAFFGHKFLQFTQASVNYLDVLTKLTLLVLLFFAIRSLFNEISKDLKTTTSLRLWNSYPFGLFVIWGLGLNIFWSMNGSVAYPILIYTAFVFALVFAVASIRHVRTLVISGQTFNGTTALLLALSSLWANFSYEISYTTIAAVVMAILVAPIIGLSRIMRLRLAAMFIGAFAAIFLPMRWFLNNLCQTHLDSCFTGSQLNSGDMFGTLIKNIINPLPFADYDSINRIQQGRLPFAVSGFVIIVAMYISIVVVSHLRTLNAADDSVEQKSESMRGFFSAQWRFTFILLSIGLSGAVLLSVSVRAQTIIDWGLSYRHTPMLWMGYAALILVSITWLTIRTRPMVGLITLVALVVLLTTGQWGRSWSAVRDYNADFEPVSRLYHELYNADLSDSGVANERRCLIIDELSSRKMNTNAYIIPAEKFMNKFHQIDFCER
jgi:hypothetical protein